MKTKTKQKALLSLLLIGLLLNIQPAFSYTFNGQEARDLISDDASGFADELRSWTVSKAIKTPWTNTIDSRIWLGGPGILGTTDSQLNEYFSRAYKTLPKHNLVTFSFSLSVCGAWNADGIKVLFDSTTVGRLQFSGGDLIPDKCGPGIPGLTDVVVSGRVAHALNTVTFKVVSDVKSPSTVASFGIREVSLIFATVATTAVKTEICDYSASHSIASGQCASATGNYVAVSSLTVASTSTKATTCNALCATCFGPSASECYSCKLGAYFDGKACVACDASCGECIGAGPSKCTKLKTVAILDVQGNSLAACTAPLRTEGDNTCCSGCDLEKYVYPDGSCHDDCCGVEVCVGCYKLCVSPCKVGFITPDGGCCTSCIPPAVFRDECGITYCDWPCKAGEHYWAESKICNCVDECPCPWECGTDAKTGIPICQPKCKPDAKEYVYFKEEDTCVCECPYGYSINKVKGLYMCEPICPCDKVYWKEGGEGQECVSKCPDGWDTECDEYGNHYCKQKCCGDEGIFWNGKCVCECGPGWKTEIVNLVPMCVPLCECGSYWWVDGACENGPGSCLHKCPEGWVEAKDDCGLDLCKQKCCEEDKPVYFAEKDQCVCECEPGWEKALVNDIWKCVPVCDCNEFWWPGCPEYGSCLDKCPDGWKCDKGCANIDICTPICDCNGPDKIFFPAKGCCVCECETGWEEAEVNGVPQCVRACKCDEYFWPFCEGACVEKCPEGWKCEKGCEDVDLCTPRCPADCDKPIWMACKEECLCECPPAWTAAEVSGVKQCVPACDCDEFWWCEGGKDGACVCECPEGWCEDVGCEGAKICSPKCDPTSDKKIWDPVEGECVCECEPGYVPQEVNGGYQCVRACKIGDKWWENCDGEGACVCECPTGWKCDTGCGGVELCTPHCKEDCDTPVWFDAKQQCVCECDKGWVEETVNGVKQCVHACDCDEYWWCEAGKEGTCVCECPEGWKCDTGCGGVNLCSPRCDCDGDKPLWSAEKQDCVCECEPGWTEGEVNGVKRCVEVCPKGEFWYPGCDGDASCLCECPEGWKCEKGCGDIDLCTPRCPVDCAENVWLAAEQKCVCDCPAGYTKAKVNDLWQCEVICACDEAWWCEGGHDGACVDKCPSGWECVKGCGDIDLCTPRCDCDGDKPIWFDVKQQCVCECEPGWVEGEVNSVKQCVRSCSCGEYWYPECEGACLDKCPEGWTCDKGCGDVDLCVPKCDCSSDKPIYSPGCQDCVCECCPGWVEQTINDVKQCAHVCECDEYWWCEGGENGACVDKCPEGWTCDKGCDGVDVCSLICPCDAPEFIWFADKHQCVCECPAGWVKAEINKAWQCVHACECGEYWWQDCGPEGACVDKCPEGWKCDKGCEYVDICSPRCDCTSDKPIWNPVKQDCVCECDDGYVSTTINDVSQCTPICEKGFYWWAAGKACVCECPTGWTWGSGCGDIDICVPACDLTCPEKNFFELKCECIPCCPPGTRSEIVNYVPTCVTICPKDELWWCEGTEGGTCVCECPLGWQAGEGPGCIPICERRCDCDGPEPVWLDAKETCVCECPGGWQIEEINNVKICDHVCEKDELWWQAGGKYGACVCDCPEAWVEGVGCEGVGICIPQCDPACDKNILLGDDCVCECPCGWQVEKVNDLNVCRKKCPEGQHWWAAGGICVCECPDGWTCGTDGFDTDICVPQCDLNCPERLWDPSCGKCVCECPAGSIISTVNKVLTCVDCYDEF